MTTITISVDNAVEKKFRQRVYQTYGRGKGVLGRAVAEAMDAWVKKTAYFDECMSLLESGIDMGKVKYSSRAELHDRN